MYGGYNLRSRSRSSSEKSDSEPEIDTTLTPEPEDEPFTDELEKTLDHIQKFLDDSQANMATSTSDEKVQYQGLMQSIAKYSGSPTEDIDDFFRQLESVARVGKWSDEVKISMAKCRMTGIALKYAISDAIPSYTDYAVFKDALIQRFEYTHPVSQYRNLSLCIQKKDEHPKDYAVRLQLATDKYFKDVIKDPTARAGAKALYEQQLIGHYTTGLRDI